MKSRFLPYLAVCLSAIFVFVSCKKESSSSDFTSESTTHADDQNRFSAEVDAAANDANIVLETSPGFSGRGEGTQSLICDATVVVDTLSNPRTITITYNGTNCLGNRTRTGVIVISMAQGVRWKNAGAQLNVTFQNFKITRVIDNKSARGRHGGLVKTNETTNSGKCRLYGHSHCGGTRAVGPVFSS